MNKLDYRARWAWVRAGIEDAMANTRTRYTPEDVFADLREEKTFAFEIGDGFILVQRRKDLDGHNLHVFLFWHPGAAPVKDELVAELLQFARNMGAKRITAEGRAGWGAVGFTEVSRNFEREVEHG